MCDIAPFGMDCINDPYKYSLTCCAVAHLACAGQELKRSLPIIGERFEPYRCSNFMLKSDGGEDSGSREKL